MYTSNALDPQLPQARVIFNLGIISTITLVLIFIIVVGGIVYAIAECRFLFLRSRNSFLTLGGLVCCHPYRMTLVIGFATVG